MFNAIRKALVVTTLILITMPVLSAEHRVGGWLGTLTSRELTTDFSLWAETQARFNFDNIQISQILYRTGLLYKLDDRHGLGFLYGFIQGGNLKEHRWTLQHTWKYGSWLNLNWSHRVRLEGRFLEQSPDDSVRFRYLIRAQTQLESRTQYVFWNETFLNVTQEAWTGDRTDERNRVFLGFRRPLYSTHIEVGYLNQWVWRSPEATTEHLLVAYIFL